MLTALLSDLNGVFVLSEKLSTRFSRDFGIPLHVFKPALANVLTKARCPGAGDSFSYWQPYLAAWGLTLDRDAFFRYWFGGERLNGEMLELARDLRRDGVSVYLVSNSFPERSVHYATHFPELFAEVDGVSYSWETGFVKPDPRAWTHVLHEHHLAPETCIVFDDRQRNVDAVVSLGVHAYLFSSATDARSVIDHVRTSHDA